MSAMTLTPIGATISSVEFSQQGANHINVINTTPDEFQHFSRLQKETSAPGR